MLHGGKDSSKVKVSTLRKKCFNLPFIIFAAEVFIPTILAMLFLFITGSHHVIMVVKLILLLISTMLILADVSYIFTKGIFVKILEETYSKDSNLGYRINLTKKTFIQILPVFLATMMFTTLLGFSITTKKQEDIYFDVYHRQLYSLFNSSRVYTIDEVYSKIGQIYLYDTSSHSIFMISNSSEITTIKGPTVSDFVKKYTIEISEKYEGRTYDSYGIDAQGSTIKINTTEGELYVGIMFSLEKSDTIVYYVYLFLILLALIIFTIGIYGKSLSEDLNTVSKSFKEITDKKRNLNITLPVVSNDEIGDLTLYFNKVQAMQKDNLTKIQNSQDELIEQERLASLGQLIGGISHNLKTPIMSIAGASEGLTDLINEYDSSVGDPEVTPEDHHAIANDMRSWVDKIHSYTTYMSDVITAVKGQAVTLSEQEQDEFTIDELLKRVHILMKHELTNSHIGLNVKLNNLQDTKIHGNVNSLVQIINNLISNSIQSYKTVTTKNTIELETKKSGGQLVLTIEDHGCGIPLDVQKKLFKEMITTKGKNGTGLGLFMSYSTIKGKFNGDMTFDSVVGKGTKFTITLPISK